MSLDFASFKDLTFTPLALQVFTAARDEAARLRHDFFEAEHVFFGLLQAPDGAASAALDLVGVDRDAVRLLLQAMCAAGSTPLERGELPAHAHAAESDQAGSLFLMGDPNACGSWPTRAVSGLTRVEGA